MLRPARPSRSKVLLYLSIFLAVVLSCRTPNSDSEVKSSGASATDIPNGFNGEHLQFNSFSECGVEGGRIKMFKSGREGLKPEKWFDESVWRKFARPVRKGEACKENETSARDKNLCWRDFGLQFYQAGTFGSRNRFLVDDVSPVWRAVPRETYPAKDACRIEKPTALIWVAGVNNAGQGTTFTKTDRELMAAILAWNRNTTYPKAVASAWHPEVRGHGKLTDLPGYIQIVQNQNTPMQGIWGRHSEPDIETMANNFELAFKSGVEWLEVVSHSNGMITAHLGYALFIRRMKSNLADFEKFRIGPDKKMQMRVRFYHLQAAPAEIWTGSSARDRFGFNSDFIPTAFKNGGFAWQWDWNFNANFNGVKKYLEPEFRFYYNAGDTLTYDDARFTAGAVTVGRRESLTWQRDIDKVRQDHKFTTPIVHFVCTKGGAECGPFHDQRKTLWDFVNPQMVDTNQPVNFQVARMGTFGQSLGLTGDSTGTQLEPTNDAEVVYYWKEGQLPDAICLGKNSDICKSGKNLADPESSLVNLPTIYCGEGATKNHACAAAVCGDGICNLEKGETCPADCRVPEKAKVCMCNPEGCFEYGASCDESGCDINAAPVQGNVCGCPDLKGLSCSQGNPNCRVFKTADGSCQLMDLVPVAAGEFKSTVCTNGACETYVPAPLGISEAGESKVVQ